MSDTWIWLFVFAGVGAMALCLLMPEIIRLRRAMRRKSSEQTKRATDVNQWIQDVNK